MVDIHREGRSQKSASQERHKVHLTCMPGNCGWNRGGDKVHCTQGECTCQAPGCLSCLGRGRHKTQAQLSLHFCGVSKNLNLSSLGLGSARDSGPASCRATWSLSSVDGIAQMPWAGANPVWLEHCECSHTWKWYLSSVPLPLHSTTEQANLNKRPRLLTCVRAEIRHWRDTVCKNRSQINKGNCFRSDRCNRLKSLLLTPTTLEGAYRYQKV